MADENMDIKLSVGFDEYDKVNNKLQKLITQLQTNNKFTLEIDSNLIQNQMKEVQNNMKTDPIDVKVAESSLNNIKKLGQNFEQLKKQMNELYGQTGSVNLTANGLDDINKFTVSVTKANGVIDKFKYALIKILIHMNYLMLKQ